MNVFLICLGIIVALPGAAVIAWFCWLQRTLLSGFAVVEATEVDPALAKEVERLQLDLQVADELGYDGNILLAIESKLAAAKQAAAVSAGVPAGVVEGAADVIFVTPPAVPEGSFVGMPALGVFMVPAQLIPAMPEAVLRAVSLPMPYPALAGVSITSDVAGLLERPPE